MAEAPLNSRPVGVERLADQLEKPLLDSRSYRVIKLPNELEALLIHDPDTDKASAAMDVNVGSFADSEDIPGMAHAVEHLLFMGTQKYPGENDYNSYLTKYGGYSNAFTASCSTNYYFELSATSTANSNGSSAAASQTSLSIPKSKAPLYGALDRFSQFFVEPLFLADTLDRELQAVDSENKKNLQSDPWRLQQLNKSLSSKEHPFHKFSTGNYKTLHDDPIDRGVKIRDEFIAFYEKHYSANRMKLAVLGRENLDELEGWVQELFADVKNKSLPRLRWDDVQAFGKDEKGTQIFAKPVMDQRMLELYFPYPDEEELFASQPGRYISHLIGHEGPGSILAYIKAKGWANGLSSGPVPQCPGTAFFTISIRLTEAGLKNYQDIVKIVWQYIAMIKEQPPLEWIVDEMSRLAEVEFRFKQKIPASRTVSMLSGVMQKPLPRDQLLSGQTLIRNFNPEAIKRGLAALRPDNFRITIVSPDFPGTWDKKEQWYGTEYRYEKMPPELLREVEAAISAPADERPADLHLPAVNEFVPQRLDVEKRLVNTPTVAPTLIRNDENVRTWFKKDDQFWVPKANIHVYMRSPLVSLTPALAVMTQLFKDLVDDTLTEYSYDAELAGLEYSIHAHSQGLDVTISGYNDKMSVLLEKVLVSMRDLDINDDRFVVVKERFLRSYRNFEYTEPFRQISSYSRWLVSERGWANFQLLEEAEAVTAEDVRRFFPQFLQQLHLELLVHGNLYKEDALNITNLVESTLRPRRLPVNQWPTLRSLVIPPGSDYRYERTLPNADNINHCVEYILSIGNNISRSTRAKLLLLSQMLDEPCFDTLRTKEQLGYVVGSGSLILTTVAGWRCLVQSEKDGHYLESRIDAFLTGFEKTIEDMGEEDFEEHKIGLINKRLERIKNLNQESGRFWTHIIGETLDFELVYRDAEHIETLTKAGILEFFRTFFLPASPSRAKTSIWLVAKASAADLAAKTSTAEKREKLVESLAPLLEQLGLEVDSASLAKQLDKIELNSDSIVAATGAYLRDTAGVAAEQVEQILEQGRTVIATILPSVGIIDSSETKVANGADGTEKGGSMANGHNRDLKKNTTVVIDNVKAFKASLPLSKGAEPVKDITEFEEHHAKL